MGSGSYMVAVGVEMEVAWSGSAIDDGRFGLCCFGGFDHWSCWVRAVRFGCREG